MHNTGGGLGWESVFDPTAAASLALRDFFDFFFFFFWVVAEVCCSSSVASGIGDVSPEE